MVSEVSIDLPTYYNPISSCIDCILKNAMYIVQICLWLKKKKLKSFSCENFIFPFTH